MKELPDVILVPCSRFWTWVPDAPPMWPSPVPSPPLACHLQEPPIVPAGTWGNWLKIPIRQINTSVILRFCAVHRGKTCEKKYEKSGQWDKKINKRKKKKQVRWQKRCKTSSVPAARYVLTLPTVICNPGNNIPDLKLLIAIYRSYVISFLLPLILNSDTKYPVSRSLDLPAKGHCHVDPSEMGRFTLVSFPDYHISLMTRNVYTNTVRMCEMEWPVRRATEENVYEKHVKAKASIEHTLEAQFYNEYKQYLISHQIFR